MKKKSLTVPANNNDDAATVDTSGNSTAASPYWRPSYEPVEVQHTEGGFSPFVAFCFAINYILGTGFLTIPWAFVQGGLLLSTVTLMAMGVVSDVAKDYLVETMARAEAMLDSRLHWRTPTQLAVSNSPYLAKIALQAQQQQHKMSSYGAMQGGVDCEDQDEEKQPLQPPMASIHYPNNMPRKLPSALSLPNTPSSSQPGSPNSSRHGVAGAGRRNIVPTTPTTSKSTKGYLVRDRKFEVNALCRVFLGKPALAVYSTFICLYIYCSLWAYACVFCSALSKALPLITMPDADADATANFNYILYAVLFASMVIPLSCLELNEQVAVQVAMTLCRFLMLFFMFTTCTTLAQDMAAVEHFDLDTTVTPLVRLAGLAQMLPICVFAHIFHHSIPGLSHPVARKRNLGSIFRATVVFSTAAYSLLGWRLGSVLGGGHLEQSANLNWKAYRGGVPAGERLPWWVQAVALYVVCFPALDVLSAFPLNAITLGNNLLGAVYGKDVHTAEENRWIRVQFRLLAGLPPIVLAILVRELGTITDYAGTTGFVIGFSFPALLYLSSRHLAEEKEFATRTHYSSYGSNRPTGWFIFSFGVAMVFYVLYFLIRGGSN